MSKDNADIEMADRSREAEEHGKIRAANIEVSAVMSSSRMRSYAMRN